MKLFNSIVVLAMLSIGCIAQIPGITQHVASSNAALSPGCCNNYVYQLPDGTKTGNTIVAVVSYADSPTTTVSLTDDKFQSYVAGPTSHDSANGRIMALFYKLNTVANARTMTFSFSVPVTQVQPRATELYHIATAAAFDGSSGNAGTDGSTTVTAGNITPTTSGDLIYQCVSRTENPAATSFTQGSQANITWQFLDADVLDGMACQWGVYSSTSTINPTFSMSHGSAYVSVAIALKAASTGSVPKVMHIVRVLHENLPEEISGASSQTLQLPCSGNLPVIKFGSGAEYLIDSITDSNGNNWFQVGTDSTTGDGAAAASVQTLVSYGALCTTDLALTINFNGGGDHEADGTLFFYDIAGAAPIQKARRIKAVGSQVNPGDLTSQIFNTPGNNRGLVLTSMSVGLNTIAGMAGKGLVDTNRCGGCSVDGPISVDENDGWGHYWITSNNPLPITWTFLSKSEGIGVWAADAVTFNAPGAHIFPNYEQSMACLARNNGTVLTCPYTPLQPGNSTLAIMVGTSATSGSVSLSDSAGNSIRPTNHTINWSEGELGTFYVPQALSQTPTTFTSTYGTSSGFRNIIIDDFSGVSNLDGHSIASAKTASDGSFHSGPWKTDAANEVIWGAALCHNTCALDFAHGFALGGTDGRGNVTVWGIVKRTGTARANFIDSGGSGLAEGAAGASFYLVTPSASPSELTAGGTKPPGEEPVSSKPVVLRTGNH